MVTRRSSDTLHPGEALRFRTRLSPVILARPLLLFALCIVFLVTLPPQSLWRVLFWLVALAVVAPSVRALVRVATTRYAVTDQRVVASGGWLRRYHRDVLATKIAGVTMGQSALGRVMDYGDVSVRDVGGAVLLATQMERPQAFVQAVHVLLDQNKLLRGNAAYVQPVRVVAVEPSALNEATTGPVTPAMAGRYCTQCGTFLALNANYCSHCGRAVHH